CRSSALLRSLLLFSLQLRRPPSPTLFPYTTLFRSKPTSTASTSPTRPHRARSRTSSSTWCRNCAAAAGCAASPRGARCGRTSSVQAASGFRTTTPAPPTSIPRPFPPRVDQLSEDVLLNPPRVEPGSQPNGGNHGEP